MLSELESEMVSSDGVLEPEPETVKDIGTVKGREEDLRESEALSIGGKSLRERATSDIEKNQKTKMGPRTCVLGGRSFKEEMREQEWGRGRLPPSF